MLCLQDRWMKKLRGGGIFEILKGWTSLTSAYLVHNIFLVTRHYVVRCELADYHRLIKCALCTHHSLHVYGITL